MWGWDWEEGSGVYCITIILTDCAITWRLSAAGKMNTIDNKISYDGHSPPSPPVLPVTRHSSSRCFVSSSPHNWPSQGRRQLLDIYYPKLSGGDNRQQTRNKISCWGRRGISPPTGQAELSILLRLACVWFCHKPPQIILCFHRWNFDYFKSCVALVLEPSMWVFLVGILLICENSNTYSSEIGIFREKYWMMILLWDPGCALHWLEKSRGTNPVVESLTRCWVVRREVSRQQSQHIIMEIVFLEQNAQLSYQSPHYGG